MSCKEHTVERLLKCQYKILIDPDNDAPCISSHRPVKDTLIQFLSNMKTIYDPQHIGVLNLALDSNGWLSTRNVSDMQPRMLDSEVCRVFVETMKQLREITFVSLSEGCRCRAGSPILPARLTPVPFEDMHCNPKPMTMPFLADTDLHHMIAFWLTFLQAFSVCSPREVRYQYLSPFVSTYLEPEKND